LAKTDQRLTGNRTIPERLVSSSDPNTTRSARANRRSPTEPGHKLLLAKDQRGFVADISLRRQREPA
jgi:hypothetical protein